MDGFIFINYARAVADQLEEECRVSRVFSSSEPAPYSLTTGAQPRAGVAGYRLRAAQAVGVSSASRWMEMSARPGSTAAR